MRVLISVRSAEETRAALRGGADIIDAKDPSQGPLGPVSADTLAEIIDVIPDSHEMSVALGDFVAPSQVVEAVSCLQLRRAGTTYLKIGVAGASLNSNVQAVLEAALASTDWHGRSVKLIAVGYGDWKTASTVPPELLCQVAAAAGCYGVLLDTYSKSGRSLLDWVDPSRLERWVSYAHGCGLLAGLSGSLGPRHLECIRSFDPDVVGFRGAGCEGGREGQVSSTRVAEIVRSLRGRSASVQAPV